MKYTVYPAYLPDPTSSMVPNAPVRVLIVVALEVALPAGTAVNAVANPTQSAISAATAPNTDFSCIDLICALSSNRSAVDRQFGKRGPSTNDTIRKVQHQWCLPTKSRGASTHTGTGPASTSRGGSAGKGTFTRRPIARVLINTPCQDSRGIKSNPGLRPSHPTLVALAIYTLHLPQSPKPKNRCRSGDIPATHRAIKNRSKTNKPAARATIESAFGRPAGRFFLPFGLSLIDSIASG